MTSNIRFKKQLEFIIEIDKLKNIIRKTKLFDGSRLENDVEHSWHLAMMALTLHEYANEKVDVLKVLKMVLIHDVVEIDAGDVFVYSTNRENQHEPEALAAKRIFGLLPEDQAKYFIEIWNEFEQKETIEARFANVLDRLEPLLQNYQNHGEAWSKYGIGAERVFKHNEQISQGSEFIWEKVQEILNECVETGILKSEEEMK